MDSRKKYTENITIHTDISLIVMGFRKQTMSNVQGNIVIMIKSDDHKTSVLPTREPGSSGPYAMLFCLAHRTCY